MWDPATRLLVPLNRFHNLSATSLHPRQPTETQDGLNNPPSGLLAAPAHHSRNMRSRNHAPANRLPMEKPAVSRSRLERMTDGMAKVQHPSQPAFAFVRRNDLGFQLHRFCDEPL